MPSAKILLEQTKSDEPRNRIAARISLLREFPPEGNEKVRAKLYSELSGDVRDNQELALGYISDLGDLQERAYASEAVSFGFHVREAGGIPQEKLARQREMRGRFVANVSSLADKLGDIEDKAIRLELAEAIAREGEKDNALAAVDRMWEIGWEASLEEPFSILESRGRE